MARPAFNADEKRSFLVAFRLTANEHALVLTYAAASLLSPSQWIRKKTINGRLPVIKTSPVDAVLYCQLQKIGADLLLATKHLKNGKVPSVYGSVLTELLQTQREILNCLIK